MNATKQRTAGWLAIHLHEHGVERLQRWADRLCVVVARLEAAAGADYLERGGGFDQGELRQALGERPDLRPVARDLGLLEGRGR